MKRFYPTFLTGIVVLLPAVATGATLDVGFTKLSGLTGGDPAGTAVYRADLSNLGFDLNSILIKDNSAGLGGSPGQFSGFDLDAIKLSTTLITDAADINALPGLSVFNFNPGGTVFTPGAQRAPVDPALFGTLGGGVNDAVATLGNFDANSSTVTPAGFVSLGDNGTIGFNLLSAIASSPSLYLYIGEVGDNGEVAAGQITVSSQTIPSRVPEPSLMAGLGALGAMFGLKRAKRSNSRVA